MPFLRRHPSSLGPQLLRPLPPPVPANAGPAPFPLRPPSSSATLPPPAPFLLRPPSSSGLGKRRTGPRLPPQPFLLRSQQTQDEARRSCTFWEGKSHLIMPNTSNRSHISLGVFNSLGPREAQPNSTVVGREKLLIDCGPDQECVLGGIVALGKFDALHIGHRELAIQASRAGTPFLLSFVGIAEVLGWEPRAPIVAKCDRKRVFSSWAPHCGNVIPQEYQVDFSTVRYLSPRQFVERLSMELGVSGVVAGENYRFGYRASGDASELVRLCKEFGLEAYIVSPVMDEMQQSSNGASTYTGKKEKASSTRVRHALAMGDMEHVAELLGRKHRLVFAVTKECVSSENRISLPKSCMLNQPPKDGLFDCCSLLVDDKFVCSCKVISDLTNIHVDLENGNNLPLDHSRNEHFISIEFG